MNGKIQNPDRLRLLEILVNDPDATTHNTFFDVFSLHIYFRTDTVYDIVTEARNLLESYGLDDKRIWINETNAAPTDDPQWPVERPVYQLDLEQQASFLMQAAALSLVVDVERIAVYKLFDQGLPPGGESFGMLSPADQTPRPAYTTWQAVTQYLGGVTQARRTQTETVDAVRLTHVDGHETLIVWARTAADVQIEMSATAEKAHLSDQYGNITLVRPVDGVYVLNLPGARCNTVDGCAVGGPVTLLVQPAGETRISVDQTQLTFE